MSCGTTIYGAAQHADDLRWEKIAFVGVSKKGKVVNSEGKACFKHVGAWIFSVRMEGFFTVMPYLL